MSCLHTYAYVCLYVRMYAQNIFIALIDAYKTLIVCTYVCIYICRDLKCMYVCMYVCRDANEKNLLLEQNCAQSLGQDNVKFLFDSEDILETGLAIQNLNVRSGYFDRYLGMIKLNLNAMDLEEVGWVDIAYCMYICMYVCMYYVNMIPVHVCMNTCSLYWLSFITEYIA